MWGYDYLLWQITVVERECELVRSLYHGLVGSDRRCCTMVDDAEDVGCYSKQFRSKQSRSILDFADEVENNADDIRIITLKKIDDEIKVRNLSIKDAMDARFFYNMDLR